eukprot:3917774-Pyramimonas_sp.AAC.1
MERAYHTPGLPGPWARGGWPRRRGLRRPATSLAASGTGPAPSASRPIYAMPILDTAGQGDAHGPW